MVDSWGYHFRLDAASCSIEDITDKEHVEQFARELVERIDMVPYGEPQVINFGEGNKAGFTLIQLIETSNIAAHFCNETGDVYLDVFSCKWFDHETVMDVFEYYFKPKACNYDSRQRQAPKVY